ncbi:hypothetical protein Q7P35_009590 [Cladosporium inversicolor]
MLSFTQWLIKVLYLLQYMARRHKRVRVVCGAAVEEDRRQIQSSTLPKRTSGTLTRQHYSTTSIHDTPPHHHRRIPPPTPPTPLLSPPPRLLRLPSTPPPRPLHPTATDGCRAKTARLLPESILKHEQVTLLLFLPPLAPRSFAIPQRIDSRPPSIVNTTKAPLLHRHLHTPSPARTDSSRSYWPCNRLLNRQHHPRLAEKQFTMAQGDQQVMRRKLVIIGDGACGKTSLLSVFTLGYFPTRYVPTVFENYVTDCRVDGKSVQLALWDTAGQEDYERLRPLAYSQAHVILIAFSVSSPDSLQNITTKWHPEVLERCPGVPIILVGLKKDLRDDPVAQEEMRKRSEKFLTAEEGEDVRKRIGAKKYLECSSLTGEGVDDVFEAATRQSLLSGDHKKQSGCCVIL